jgi:hypothetical protein
LVVWHIILRRPPHIALIRDEQVKKVLGATFIYLSEDASNTGTRGKTKGSAHQGHPGFYGTAEGDEKPIKGLKTDDFAIQRHTQTLRLHPRGPTVPPSSFIKENTSEALLFRGKVIIHVQ